MQVLSATEVKQNFGAALDAAQREPVWIQKQNRDVAVLISTHEYEKLHGLQIDALKRIKADIAAEAKAKGLTEEKLAELLADV
jgi:prevent-host-death family protein